MRTTEKRATADAWVDEEFPGKHHSRTSRLRLDGTAAKRRRIFLFAGRPFAIGNSVVQVILHMHARNAWPGSHDIKVNRVSDGWSEKHVNWNNQPPVAGATVTKTVVGLADKDEVEIDVTSIYEEVTTGSTGHGVRLNLPDGDANRLSFYAGEAANHSMRPWFEFKWSEKPEPPRDGAPAGANAISLVKPTYDWRFGVKGRDPDQRQSAFKLQVAATSTGFGAPLLDTGKVLDDKTMYDSGAGALSLVDGTTYFWRVMAWDDDDLASDWSDVWQFKRLTQGVLALNSPAPYSDRENLVTNPKAGAGSTAGWTNSGLATFTAVSSLPTRQGLPDGINTGFRAVGAAGGALARFDFPVTNGQTYRASMYVRLVSLTATNLQAIIRDAANVGKGSVNYTAVGGGFARLDIQFTADATATWSFRISQIGAGAAEWHFTAVLIEKGTTLGTYFDGDTEPDSMWTGAANTSTSRKGTHVSDLTPPITWLFTGRTQAQYEVILFKQRVSSTGKSSWKKVWHTPRRKSTDTSINVPAGIIKRGQLYKVRVRVWDDQDRQSVPGDQNYVQVSRVFSYARDGTPNPVTNFTAVPYASGIALEWDAATEPDYFCVTVNGVEVIPRLEPADVLVTVGTPSHYRYVFWRGEHNIPITMEIERVVATGGNLLHSGGNPQIEVTPRVEGKWLVDESPTETLAVQIIGSPDPDQSDFQIGESGETFNPLNAAKPVRVIDAIRGFEGSASGALRSTDGARSFLDLKGRQRTIRYLAQHMNIPVRLGESSLAPKVDAHTFDGWVVGTDLFQVGEFADVIGLDVADDE